jgi:hypothetical protein
MVAKEEYRIQEDRREKGTDNAQNAGEARQINRYPLFEKLIFAC